MSQSEIFNISEKDSKKDTSIFFSTTPKKYFDSLNMNQLYPPVDHQILDKFYYNDLLTNREF